MRKLWYELRSFLLIMSGILLVATFFIYANNHPRHRFLWPAVVSSVLIVPIALWLLHTREIDRSVANWAAIALIGIEVFTVLAAAKL